MKLPYHAKTRDGCDAVVERIDWPVDQPVRGHIVYPDGKRIPQAWRADGGWRWLKDGGDHPLDLIDFPPADDTTVNADSGERDADWYAVNLTHDYHVGMWKDRPNAEKAANEYPDATVIPLYTRPTPAAAPTDNTALVERLLRQGSAVLGPYDDMQEAVQRNLMVYVNMWQFRQTLAALASHPAEAASSDAALTAQIERLTADRDALAEALRNVMKYIPLDVVECRGDKCREPWCASCYGWTSALQHMNVVRSNAEAAAAVLAKMEGKE